MIRSCFISQCETNGLERTSVASLCKACGIAKSTFYLYFDDKFSVLDAIKNDLLNSFRKICFDLGDVKLEDIMKGKPVDKALLLLRFLKENNSTLRFLLGRNGDQHFIYRWKKDIEDSFLKRFIAERSSRQSAEIACTIFSYGLIGIYTHITFGMPNISEEQLAIIIANLLRYCLIEFDAFT